MSVARLTQGHKLILINNTLLISCVYSES